jgi:hypothetical protein
MTYLMDRLLAANLLLFDNEPTWYNWQMNQLSSRPYGLDAKIKHEIKSNEGGSMWSVRKVRLENQIAQMNSVLNNKSSNKGGEQYTDFKTHAKIPAVATKLYIRKRHRCKMDLMI